MKSEMKVTFTINNIKCDPEEISKALGLKPTNVQKKGSIISFKHKITKQTIVAKEKDGSPKLRKNGFWELQAKETKTPDLEKMIASLLSKLSRKKLFKLKKNYRGLEWGIDCVLYLNENAPIVYLSEKTVIKLAKYQCYIDIDLYRM